MNSKISLALLPNGRIAVDWSQLPKHANARQCVIHYKSVNTNESQAVRVSKKSKNLTLDKIQAGHLYEVHVSTVDESKRILATSERAQIQTKALDPIPVLRVVKTTPDFVHLQWEKPAEVQQSDIQSYKLNINGDTKAHFPSNVSSFVVNDGRLGKRYLFQIEMVRKNGKVAASIPVSLLWPGVSVPEHHVFINGCQELMICWGDSISVNDGNIQSYTLDLYDSSDRLLQSIGPNTPECRQVWIRDISVGIYYYVLELKLSNSTKAVRLKRQRVECGRDSTAPILTYTYVNYEQREELSHMAHQLIKIRDNFKSGRFLERCNQELEQILVAFAQLTDLVRLHLTIQLRSQINGSQTFRLFIDGNESNIALPGNVNNFPLQLPQRLAPYRLSVSVEQDFTNTKSKEVLVEASGEFPFFCAHFSRRQSNDSCSYLSTLSYEKERRPTATKGPSKMNEIVVYDLKEEKVTRLPSSHKGHRLSIYFFYLKRCIPSIAHYNYYATYASLHRTQYNYISINCETDNKEQMKLFTQESKDIQCFTDFRAEDVQYEGLTNEKPIPELLELDGVPTYFILNFASRVIWRGRLCVSNQDEYNNTLDHILARSQQQGCTIANCELCSLDSANETQIESQLKNLAKNFDALHQQQQMSQIRNEQQNDKLQRKRCVVSMKSNQEYQ